jgi:hypothetical protein
MAALIAFGAILKAVEQLPKVIAAAPEFKNLFDQMIKAFQPHQQSQLKTAYAKAIETSDSAQADFVEASRGR